MKEVFCLLSLVLFQFAHAGEACMSTDDCTFAGQVCSGGQCISPTYSLPGSAPHVVIGDSAASDGNGTYQPHRPACGGQGGYIAIASSASAHELQASEGCECTSAAAQALALERLRCSASENCQIIKVVRTTGALAVAADSAQPTKFTFGVATLAQGKSHPRTAYLEPNDGSFAARAAYIQVDAYEKPAEKSAMIQARNAALQKCGAGTCHTVISDGFWCN